MNYNTEKTERATMDISKKKYQTTTNDNDDDLRQRLVDRNARVQITLYGAVWRMVHNRAEKLSTTEAEADSAIDCS